MAVAPSPFRRFSSTALNAICPYAQVCKISREEVELQREKLSLADPKCSVWQEESEALKVKMSLNSATH